MKNVQDKIRILPGDPEILGANILADGINFAVVVPDDAQAELILCFGSEECHIPLWLQDRIGEISAVRLKGLKSKNFGYYYVIDGKKTLDPFAAGIKDELCYLDHKSFDWQEERAIDRPFEDMLIYKLHVRGFTKKKGSGVPHKGTFRGVTEKIPYIKALGFNTVELLPMYEWDENLKTLPPFAKVEMTTDAKPVYPKNYWGYAEKNYYFAPKQSFSHSKDCVREVKEMIRAFHQADIEVIMEMYFPAKISPSDAHRAVRYWKKNYHIDGFRFVGEGVPMEALVRDPLLKRTKLIFDRVDVNWLYDGQIPTHRCIAEANNDFMECGRRLLKGDDGQVLAFSEKVRRNPREIGVINYMAAVNGFTLSDTVSYDWKHNEVNGENNQDGPVYNYSWNCGAEGKTKKRSVLKLRSRQVKNALLYLFISQGAPMLLAGDECGNTQLGNNNAYSSDNSLGWTDWNHTKADLALRDFVAKLAAFRMAHPILHGREAFRGIDYKNIGYPDISYHDARAWMSSFEYASRTVGMMFCGLYAKDENDRPDDFIYVACNAYWETHDFGLPNLPPSWKWQVAIDTSLPQGEEFVTLSEENLLRNQKMITAKERSVIVLIGRKYEQKQDLAKNAAEEADKPDLQKGVNGSLGKEKAD